MSAQIRPIRPSDYRPVMSVIDDWWNGRHMADMLPRLFFEHFTDTSFAAECYASSTMNTRRHLL